MVTKPLRADLFRAMDGNERLVRAFEELFEESGAVTASNDTILVQASFQGGQDDSPGEATACPVLVELERDPVPAAMPVALEGLIEGVPSDGDVLRFNATSGEWEPLTGATGTFDAASGETVTVTNGIITAIV
jgi:hypothetical protein